MNKPELEAMNRLYKRDLIPGYDEKLKAVAAIQRLRRINAKLHRINEDDCNGNPTTKTERRDGKLYRYEVQDEKRAAANERTEARLTAEAQDIATRWGWSVNTQGDPRGSAIKLALHPDDAHTVDYIGADTDLLV
jgi:hypothetical protein